MPTRFRAPLRETTPAQIREIEEKRLLEREAYLKQKGGRTGLEELVQVRQMLREKGHYRPVR